MVRTTLDPRVHPPLTGPPIDLGSNVVDLAWLFVALRLERTAADSGRVATESDVDRRAFHLARLQEYRSGAAALDDPTTWDSGALEGELRDAVHNLEPDRAKTDAAVRDACQRAIRAISDPHPGILRLLAAADECWAALIAKERVAQVAMVG